MKFLGETPYCPHCGMIPEPAPPPKPIKKIRFNEAMEHFFNKGGKDDEEMESTRHRENGKR
jgi:hypothetical protein